ncbi:MAG: hypothetical protein FJ044_00050 [Candidatus Cloacimonetes bacterium]|nr:hypothetical protein [Candidatus Cloacimonadota bacterium]
MKKLILLVVGVGLLFVGLRAYPLLTTLPGPLSVLAVVPKEGFMGLGGLLTVLSGVWVILGFFRKRPTQKWSTQRQFVPAEAPDEDEEEEELPIRPVPVRQEFRRERQRSAAKKGGFFGLSWVTVAGIVVLSALVLLALLQLGASGPTVAPAQVQSQPAAVEKQKVRAIVPSTEKRVVLNVGAVKYTGPDANNLGAFLTNATKLGEVSQEEINIALAQNGFLVTKEYPDQNAIEIYVPSCEQNCAEGPATVLAPFGYPFEAVPVEAKSVPTLTPESTTLPVPEGTKKKNSIFELLAPLLVYTVLVIIVWRVWIRITKPEAIAERRVEFHFKDWGSASFGLTLVIARTADPEAFLRARDVGTEEAEGLLFAQLVDLARSNAESLSITERYKHTEWLRDLNRRLIQRQHGVEVELPIELLHQEKSCGYVVTGLRFGDVELDPATAQALETKARQMEEVAERDQQTLDLIADFAAFCTAQTLQPSPELFQLYMNFKLQQVQAQAELLKAEAAATTAHTWSEFASDLSPDEIVRATIDLLKTGAMNLLRGER